MSLWTRRSRIIVTCAKGIVPFLREEVLFMGFPVRSEGIADVETEGTMNDTMGLNLFLRTGHRVLFLLREFKAKGPDELYEGVSGIEWEDYIPEVGYLSVTSSVETPAIKDSRFANLKCKDAIVDRLKERLGSRPDSGPKREGTVIHLYWKGARCQIYIDTSGEPLSKRGYRRIPLKAPMQETLAAAVVLAKGWRGEGNFINPMCGSGTLAIEAALIGLNRAPGLLRENYGFMHIKGFDESSWKALRKKARETARKDLKGKIIATDISPEAVRAARKNAATAGVGHLIEFGICDFSETPVPMGKGVVLLNPEYGERLGRIEELKETYKGIGDFFKRRCVGYRGYIFTGNLDLAKRVGLRTKRRIPFFNSNIECRLLEYDLYEGSKKKQTPGSEPQ
ncbi:MAG: class I SAM-dependent RNA methyltransferase [Syntrophaceae bacterium]|nr:class I SAM-dependent RNA methyltransferase [Syntrophaceae bacterium]